MPLSSASVLLKIIFCKKTLILCLVHGHGEMVVTMEGFQKGPMSPVKGKKDIISACQM